MRRGPNAGVTLIELLIAVTLVSLISVGVLMALRVGLVALDRTNSRMMANRRAMGAQRILQQELAGFIPVGVRCGAQPGQIQSGIEARFFQGEPGSMRFVSTYSIQEAARGRPQILEFLVISGEDEKGVRLVVNEIPYAGPFSTLGTCMGMGPDPVTRSMRPVFRPITAGPNSFVLADKLAYCRFMYREAPLFRQRQENWVSKWSRGDEWPSAVRVEMGPLSPDPGRPQPLPVTIALKADRDPTNLYAEQQQ